MIYTITSCEFNAYCNNVKTWIERFAKQNSYLVEDYSNQQTPWFKISFGDFHISFLAIRPTSFDYGFCCDIEYVIQEWGNENNFRDLIFSCTPEMKGLTKIVNKLKLNYVKDVPNILPHLILPKC